MSPRASILLATYNMPRHLALVLSGLSRQTEKNFEIILCDDGSGPDTAAVLGHFQGKFLFPVIHVWQEHQGFRKSKILNEGIARSTGSTLIFLDGDCVPGEDFVRDHLDRQEQGFYCAGRRVELGRKVSESLTSESVLDGYFDRLNFALIFSFLFQDSEHLQRTYRVTHPLLRKWMKFEKVDDLKGCNFSVSRKAMEEINGFDEAYEGYGREDTDVELRLQHLGLKIKSLKGIALQYHVWHERRGFTPSNETRLAHVRAERIVRCDLGLDGHKVGRTA